MGLWEDFTGTLSRAFDQVNPFDNGKDWNNRVGNPVPRKKPDDPVVPAPSFTPKPLNDLSTPGISFAKKPDTTPSPAIKPLSTGLNNNLEVNPIAPPKVNRVASNGTVIDNRPYPMRVPGDDFAKANQALEGTKPTPVNISFKSPADQLREELQKTTPDKARVQSLTSSVTTFKNTKQPTPPELPPTDIISNIGRGLDMTGKAIDKWNTDTSGMINDMVNGKSPLDKTEQQKRVSLASTDAATLVKNYNSADDNGQRDIRKTLESTATDYGMVSDPTLRQAAKDAQTKLQLLNPDNWRELKAAGIPEVKNKQELGNTITDIAGTMVSAPFKLADKVMTSVKQNVANESPFDANDAQLKNGEITQQEHDIKASQINKGLSDLTGSETGKDKGDLDRLLRSAGTAAEAASYFIPGGAVFGDVAAPTFSKVVTDVAVNTGLGLISAYEKGTDTSFLDLVMGGGAGFLSAAGGDLVGGIKYKMLKDNKLTAEQFASLPRQTQEDIVKKATDSLPVEDIKTLSKKVVDPAIEAKVAEKSVKPTAVEKLVSDAQTPAVVPIEPVNVGTKQFLKQKFLDSDQPIIDELRNIEKQTGRKDLVDKFMYRSNMQRGSNVLANETLSTSHNIREAISGLSKKDYKSFSEYANARTELASALDNKITPGKVRTSLPIEELSAKVKNGDAAFSTRFEALNQHYKELATVWHDAGIIDDQTFKKYTANNDYVRLQRDMGDKLPGNTTGRGNAYALGSTTAKQHRVGSSKQTLDVGMVTAERTQQVYREAARNKTGTMLVDTLQQSGLAHQVKPKDAAGLNTVSIFRNGKKEFYQVTPDMKQAIDNINPYSMNVVMKILAAPGRLARAGITGLNPVFIVRNIVKDQQSSAIQSGHMLSNLKQFFPGLFSATKDAMGGKNSPIYEDFLKHYGDITSYDLARNTKDAAKVVNRIRGGKVIGVGQAIKSPIRTLENIASITEKSTRFQNYAAEYKRAIKQGLTPEASSERAAIAAWQNTVDFSRAGDWGRVINMVIPYWNPATQGVRQMARSVTKHPIKTIAAATATIGVPLAAATAWNLSSPENVAIYNNIPEYEKENNLIIIPPGTKQNQDGSYDLIKIPLAPGWKDAFMPVRRSMEAFQQDKPLEFDKMAFDVLQTVGGPVNFQSPGAFIGSFTPQAVKPFVQQAMNQDMFSGNTIVPDYVEQATDANGTPIAENKKAYKTTSGTAREIGNILNVSPIRVEKFIKDTAGSVGLQILNQADVAQANAGIIPFEQIGGQSVSEGLDKSFSKTSSIVNANASEGAKYYDRLKTATAGLTGNELAGFSSLHPSKKNFLGETVNEPDSFYNATARLDIYSRFPKVLEADRKLDKASRDSGKVGNPLFDLTPEQLKKVLEKESLPPGAKDPELKNLYNEKWYTDYVAKKAVWIASIITPSTDTATGTYDRNIERNARGLASIPDSGSGGGYGSTAGLKGSSFGSPAKSSSYSPGTVKTKKVARKARTSKGVAAGKIAFKRSKTV